MEEKQEFNGLLLNDLAKIKRWTRFLSVLSYIGGVFMVIAGISILIFGSSISGMGSLPSFFGPLFSLIYLGGSALYYFSGKYLGDISKSADMAGSTSETSHIESLISAAAKLFSFYGVIVAVILVIYLLIIVVTAMLGISNLL